MPRVSVIVPARDSAATLPATLAALALQDADHEVIVVDDGSTDDTARIARDAGATVVGAGGEGPSRARNAGAAVATGELLAFTDADCVPEPGWLRAALAAGGDVVQGPVVPDGPAGPFDRTVSVGAPSPLFETANLVVSRSWFQRVGGFEGWLLPGRSKELGEDVWLGWRLRRAGARVAWAPEAVVRHAVFPRDARGYVVERLRLRFFPALVKRIPELRDELCFAGIFLTRRTAAFDAAAVGAGMAAATVSVAPLVAALPYAALALAGRPRPRVVAARLAADAAGLAALVAGSLRHRSLLL